jgi:queuine/archaeosine tRNA-ribosyltransferase
MIALAEKRSLAFPDGAEFRTPLLLPAFSSRVSKIDNIFRTVEDIIDGPILISAYDIKHNHLTPPYDWASVIFLDSGGYEISKDTDLSDVGDELAKDRTWTLEEHSEVISSWSSETPLVVVSYDHPQLRYTFREQIDRALQLKLPPNAVREILLKPETPGQHFIQLDSLLKAVRGLADFDIIGITEKEIGNSVFERMRNIARLRIALTAVGIKKPVHIFGSLDTTTTLFYFVAGADIFDGLTWLRYAFREGRTLYKQDFGITEIGVTIKAPAVEAVCWSKNYNYLQEMQREMRRFLNAYDFSVFTYHSELLKSVAESIEESVRA